MDMSQLTALESLSKALPTEYGKIAIVFVLLGHCFHLAIRNVEIDTRIWSLLGLYGVIWIGLVGLYMNLIGLHALQSVFNASLCGVFFNTGLFLSIAIYRLLLHRTRHFPGPIGARLSRFYAVWLTFKSETRYHLVLQDLHAKYGDFVRTGPREISVTRASAVYKLYGPQSECQKASWYSQTSSNPDFCSIHTCRDPNKHRLRRKVWDRAMGMKAIKSYEPRIKEKVDIFINQLRSRQNTPINSTAWSMYFAFDVMGTIGFGKDMRQLQDAAEHSAVEDLHAQLAVMGYLTMIPWFLCMLTAIPGLVGKYGGFFDYVNRQVEERKQIWKSDKKEEPEDVFSHLLKACDHKDPSAPPTDRALNEDARVIMAAGSDTTGVTVANILYYLASHPLVYRKLQSILDGIIPEGETGFDYEKVKNIPYLEAIISETLRLKPIIPSGEQRLTPACGLQIDELWIPGDTIVIIPQWTIYRDERYFPHPTEFIPERWLEEKAQLVKDERAFFPFLLGVSVCAGKQLAMMEMRSVLSRIALNFDISFAPGEDGVAFDQDTHDSVTLVIGKLNLLFTERSKV